jgi:hypothetical protein
VSVACAVPAETPITAQESKRRNTGCSSMA